MLSHIAIRCCIVLAFACLALSVTSPKSLNSDLTIFIHNDLLGPDSPLADSGVILLTATKATLKSAENACAELGEQVWAPEIDTASIQSVLDYLVYEYEYDSEQDFWISSDSTGLRTINAQGKVKTAASNLQLPVLCTQTAPFSNQSFEDTSSRWQISLPTNNEVITGFRDRLTFRFLGVRYALQPERFTYSTPYIGTGATNVSALTHGSECVQAGPAGAEDCLFMNIFTPYLPANSAAPAQKLRPVMFWIHGGGYTVGTGNDPIMDGANIASRGDVVVVTINYRLTTFGFAVFNDTKANGNYGIADQITALQWVQDHIRDFGGDPDRVTVFGQSAGATSIRALLSSTKSSGLFVGAIPHSILGGGLDGTHYSAYATIASVLTTTNKILAQTNCTNASSPVDCVRAVPAYTLMGIANAEASVVIDGTYITTPALILNGTGPDLSHIHFLSGAMRDDGAAVAKYTGTTNLTASEVASEFNIAAITPELFPSPGGANESLNVWNITARIETDYVFRCFDQATAYAGVVNGIFAGDVYYYEANRSYQYLSYQPNPPLCNAPITPTHPYGDPSMEYDKCHAGDLINVFATGLRTGLPMRDEFDQKFMQYMIDAWTSFARSWDPNPDGGLLGVRGYVNTTREVEMAGRWAPVGVEKPSLRSLQWPSRQMPMTDVEQCAALGFPIDMLV